MKTGVFLLGGIHISLSDWIIYKKKRNAPFILSNKSEMEEDTFCPKEFSDNIDENIGFLKEIYSMKENADFLIREFYVRIGFSKRRAAIAYYDGMTNGEATNLVILKGLMTESHKVRVFSVDDLIKTMLPEGQLKTETSFQKVLDRINIGFCLIMIDGEKTAFMADIKKWAHRPVEAAKNELNILGPQQSFNESIRENTSLIRRIIRNENLIIKEIPVGTITKTTCAVLYMRTIANQSLVKEVFRRIEGLDVDSLISSAELEQLLEDKSTLTLPQMLSTEKPDRAARAILQGRVAVIVDGSPFAIVMPVTVMDVETSGEDPYLRFPFRLFSKTIRLIGLVLSIFLPAFYLAIITYHSEVLPTDMLIALVASLEKVPFTTLMELLFLEISFEIIREASVMTPSNFGSTLGIVGALILGQAAVSANLVDPVLIIVVSITGISSFSTPGYGFAYANRILKFMYIFLAYLGGFLGIVSGMFVHLLLWSSAHSFGVPMLVPFSPSTDRSSQYFSPPIWKNENRPDFLNVQRRKQQKHIARRWTQDEQ